jgi:hypothetical protein
MNVAAFKESRGRAENKIDMSLDVTVFKILTATIQKQSVLPSEKPTIAKHCAITIDSDRQCLSDRSGAILKSDVLCQEIVRIYNRRRCAKRPNGFVVSADDVGMKIKRQYGFRSVFADQPKETLFMLNVNQFLVDTRSNMNDYGILRCTRRHRHYGFLNALKLCAAIQRNADVDSRLRHRRPTNHKDDERD